ncbi:MAG: hypothetical protein HY763_07240 [Planctomycetes bacterium]|nr:hypothetical protein [Planctomycetota bacterium]
MGNHRGSFVRRSGTAVAACALVWSATAVAAPMALTATQAQSPASTFTLDFGQFGGVASANISSTEYELEIDPAAGTARFQSYLQHVEPLILPDGSPTGVSTGDITVEIIQSLGGTFDRATGTFLTDDVYAVHFTGDLSMFGITSPFILPSTSAGSVAFDAVNTGTTSMAWVGDGLLSVIPFHYACTVSGVFSSTNATPYIATSTPDTGAIDARAPHGLNSPFPAFGWDTVELTLNAPLAAVSDSEFAAEGLSADGTPLSNVTASLIGPNTVRVMLGGPIAAGTWARVTHAASGTHVCVALLPGDVNGDRVSGVRDINALIDSLNGVPGRVLPLSSTDLDRSSAVNTQDVTTLINLLNGAAAFDRWFGARLTASPCE